MQKTVNFHSQLVKYNFRKIGRCVFFSYNSEMLDLLAILGEIKSILVFFHLNTNINRKSTTAFF